jgi:hypothetical protein
MRLLARDLVRKPATTPDHVRGKLFEITLFTGA